MRIPRKLKKKRRKQEWKHFLDNSEEIITEMLRKEIMEDLRKGYERNILHKLA